MIDLDVHDYGAYSDVGDDDHDFGLSQNDCCNPLFAEPDDDDQEAWDWDDGEAYGLHTEDASSVCVLCENPDADGYSMFDAICDHHLAVEVHTPQHPGLHHGLQPGLHAAEGGERPLDAGPGQLVLVHSQNLVRAARVWESVKIIRLIMLRKRSGLDILDVCPHAENETTLAHLPIEILELILHETGTAVFADISTSSPFIAKCQCPRAKRFDDLKFWEQHAGFRKWLNNQRLDGICNSIPNETYPQVFDVTTSKVWKAMYPSAADTTNFVQDERNWDAAIDHAARYGFVDDRPSDEGALSREFDHVASVGKARDAWEFTEGQVYRYCYSPEGCFDEVEQLLTGGPGSQYVACYGDLCPKERTSMLTMLRWLSDEGPWMDVERVDSRQGKSRYESHVFVSPSAMLAYCEAEVSI